MSSSVRVDVHMPVFYDFTHSSVENLHYNRPTTHAPFKPTSKKYGRNDFSAVMSPVIHCGQTQDAHMSMFSQCVHNQGLRNLDNLFAKGPTPAGHLKKCRFKALLHWLHVCTIVWPMVRSLGNYNTVIFKTTFTLLNHTFFQRE